MLRMMLALFKVVEEGVIYYQGKDLILVNVLHKERSIKSRRNKIPYENVEIPCLRSYDSDSGNGLKANMAFTAKFQTILLPKTGQ